jgi:predicted unusual protein kinase regulating ubiquinone biosynthesis (AarF/ABC1/UbiB family)
MGQLAGGIAGGMVSEGARQLIKGERPGISDLILTPGNLKRIGDKLSEMRGAAMKFGQLISMDNGHLMPPHLSELLARLRDNGHAMPMLQLAEVLERNWGSGWESHFSRFNFTPIAAASIGQVHKAVLKDGQALAVKVQYPGIGHSIDSDVDNVGTLLNLFNLLPEGLDIDLLLSEAKRQLHQEADYLYEAQAIRHFQKHLQGDERVMLPAVVDELTTTEVLAMEHLDGDPIESVAQMPQQVRDHTANLLMELGLKEVFDWGIVQTDPNFSNYLFCPDHERVQLLDFGATRIIDPELRRGLWQLLRACIEGGESDMLRAAEVVGYLGDGDPESYRDGVLQLLLAASEPMRGKADYDFSHSDLPQRMSEMVMEMRLKTRYNRLPPMDVLFLHRKIAGLFLLFSRLNARIDVNSVLKSHIDGFSL